MRLMIVWAVTLLASAVVAAEPKETLRYSPELAAKYVYEVHLEIDELEGKKNQTGSFTYKPIRINKEQISFEFSGGVSNLYPSRANLKFSISPLGELQSINQDVQLPSMLGSLPDILFIPFAKNAADSWKVSQKVSLTRSGSSSRDPLYAFRTMGPFSVYRPLSRLPFLYSTSNDRDKRVTSGTETERFEIVEKSDSEITVHSKYELTSAPDVEGYKTSIDGTGVWKLDNETKMPVMVELSRTLSVAGEKLTVKVPIQLTAKLIPAEVLAKRAAESKKRMEELQRVRKAPLTQDEKKELFANLKSGDLGKVSSALSKLTQKQPEVPDMDVVAALKTIDSDNKKRMQSLIDRVEQAFSPEEVRAKLKLNADYRGHGTVDSSNRVVDGNTELRIGEIIQFKRHERTSFWHPGRIRAVLDGGRVLIAENPPFERTHELDRSRIQLAPLDVDQPDFSGLASGPAAQRRDKETAGGTSEKSDPQLSNPFSVPEDPFGPKTEIRTWTDSSGTYQIEASIVKLDDENITLYRKIDGRQVTLPRSKLSAKDQKHLESLPKKPKIPNPFEPK